MNNEIKREMEKIKIPEELHQRSELGIKQAKKANRKAKRFPKWITGAAAAVLIVGAGFSIGGSQLTDAAETLLGKFVGTEIQDDMMAAFPEEAIEALPQMEQHLEFAKTHLSPEDFENYSQLVKERTELLVAREQPDADKVQIDKRIQELDEASQQYGLADLTTYTLEEAQAMVDYPLHHPTYIPEGYELIREEIYTEEAHFDEDPTVFLDYLQTDGEMGFYTRTEKTDPKKEDELTWYEHIDTYVLHGYTFTHGYDDQGIDTGNVEGMKVTIPELEYEVIIHADILTKEEMEKILLSMVE